MLKYGIFQQSKKKNQQFAARISASFSRFVYSLINRFLCLIIVPVVLLQLFKPILLPFGIESSICRNISDYSSQSVIAGEYMYNRFGTGYLPGTEVNHDNNTDSFYKTFV